ncbi:MAG TPA: YoaK family protein [Chitinophaga sp.]
MLRHRGQRRTYRHNLQLAILLCLTAGMVNGAGFLAFAVLTTNVTGHAALLAQQLATGDLRAARMVLLWLLLFLAGAFFTSFLIGKAGRNKTYAYTLPISIEVLILLLAGAFGYTYDHSIPQTEYFAGSLLFAMGMQNALVSVISGSVVRTTHLTGMFTDLGIELYAALSSTPQHRQGIKKKITLRLVIIASFLTGGIAGAYIFLRMAYHAFYIPAVLLAIAMFYDAFRIRFRRMLTSVSPRVS